jgi:exopolysaccharide production protein ExoQ
MSPQIATLVFILGITGLFWLDRKAKARPSIALWIPVIWLWIVGSREVSRWIATFQGAITYVSTGENPYLEGNPIDRIVYALLMVLGVVVIVRRWPRVLQVLRANKPILLFFLYCGISVLWSDHSDVSFKRWLKSLGDLIVILVVLTEADPVAAIKSLLVRVGFLLAPISILFIKYYSMIGKAFKHYGLAIYVGVAITKNLLGVICLLFGLASLWRFINAYKDKGNKTRVRQLIAHGTMLVMTLWLFKMAQSMTSLACFSMAGAIMIATTFSRFARKQWVVHCLVAGAVSVAAASLFIGIDPSVLKAMGKDPTLTGRTEIWKLVLGMTGNPLLGTGFESFWLPGWRLDKIWAAYWWHPNEAHDGYIEVFLNLGLVGVTLLGSILVSGYRKVLTTLRSDLEMGTLKLAYFVMGVVYSFTEAGFRMMDPVWIIFLLSIMVLPRIRRRADARRLDVHRLNSKPAIPREVATEPSEARFDALKPSGRFQRLVEGDARPDASILPRLGDI